MNSVNNIFDIFSVAVLFRIWCNYSRSVPGRAFTLKTCPRYGNNNKRERL